MGGWTLIGCIAVVYLGILFVKRLGKSVPILELMTLIGGLQWIIGPIIEYSSPSGHYKYFMYVDQEIYMGFVVPAYLAFMFVILYGVKKSARFKVPISHLEHYSQYGLIIFGIGVFFDLIGGFLPGALGFFAFILSNFKFAGAIILFFSKDPLLKKVFYGAIAYLFVIALAKALFHDLILWSVFFYMFWAIKNKPSISFILTTFLIATLSLATLQTIKTAYRSQVWQGYSGNKIELFVTLMAESFVMGNATEEADQGEIGTNVRLNQGWIISAVINNIPKYEPFFNGETIKTAVYSSLLPRFLNPNKAEAGGQDNFRTFTGLSLSDGTSMGISIIGEAYGNFGKTGGIIFMGLWGVFLVKVWSKLFKIVLNNIVFISFLPLAFLQVIKAETELVVVLNHLIKSLIVILFFFWYAKNYLNWNFSHETKR
ncbi:hypothetical protein [Winogradskyella wichelsiae]|uniref:hypothetical protein n=1 Tax=Winogradskyella wichelsiae TaxID=2697007 RepID=UPI0015C93076|nr:hypothetical protein [Winogradskyella wichelsiae]